MNAAEDNNSPVTENTPMEADVTNSNVDAKPQDVRPRKSKLGLILGLFVLGAGAILATQYVLQGQIPQPDANFTKEADTTERSEQNSGTVVAPAM